MKSVSFANFFHLSLNQGVNVLVAVVITPLLYQTLGEGQFGLVGLGLTVVMFLSVLVNYGFHLNGPKRLALTLGDTDKQQELVNEIIVTKLMLSVVLSLLILIAIYGFNFFPDYSSILSLSLVILLGEALFPMFILQGLDKLSLVSVANAISKLFYLIAVVIVVKEGSDAKWVNFLFGVSSVIVNFGLLVFVYRKWGLRFYWVNAAKVFIRIKENFQFFLSTIGGHLSVHGGYIILSNFVSEVELGRYNLAQRVAFLLRMIPVFLTQSILQSASRLYHENESDFNEYLSKAYKSGLALTFAVGLGFAITSSYIIRILGGEYVDYSANVLRLLCFIPFFGMLNVANMIKILVAERKEILAKATWVTAIFMLVIAMLGSYYYGGYGLAVALLLSEVLSFAVHYYLLKKYCVLSNDGNK
ncbi:oligosaccharide flippase family protein [Roseivirga sp.]|uniref:oligosaccharide flippase family protein n=1 Tax=Roseivirga sp. TaxID=1964215 RepID=UPI002B26895C|nr:oligosaccharide flippase family protein [Roseivirga sp.]